MSNGYGKNTIVDVGRVNFDNPLSHALTNLQSMYAENERAKREDARYQDTLARQAEQDAMRKAEYDLRMGEAQRAISQRDLLNTVGRDSARQVQPHLLAQNQPLLERLNAGTVEGWKAYEQEVAGKDAEVANLLARRDAYAKDRAAGVGEAQFSNEEADLLRSRILGYKTKGGDTVQSLATGAYESYVPIKEDASNFMMRRLLDAGVDIDSASDYVKRSTEWYKDRATLTAEGVAARDAAMASDEARIKNELDKAKILADINRDYSGVLGRTISQGMTVDPETGMVTGVRTSGAKKGTPFSISAKDVTVYDVLESYPDYVGNDVEAKEKVMAVLNRPEYANIPENIKAAITKHSIEDASYGILGIGPIDNRVNIPLDKLQTSMNSYLNRYNQTGQAPSFESGVLNKAEAVKNQLIKSIESINPRSDIPMAMTAEQVRDSAPMNRLKVFLSNTRAPERTVQQPVKVTRSSAPVVSTVPSNEEVHREEVLSEVAEPVQRVIVDEGYVVPTPEELAAMGRRPTAGNSRQQLSNALSNLEALRSRMVNQPTPRAVPMPRLVNSVPSVGNRLLSPEESERLSRFLLDTQNR